MKQFIASLSLDVSAETVEEARKIARKWLSSLPDCDLRVVEVEPLTIRCDECHGLYRVSEVCEVDGKTICVVCGISPEDIPF